MEKFDLLLIAKGDKDEVVSSPRNSGILKLVDYSSPDYDDKIVLHGDVFRDLYDMPRYKAPMNLKLLAVIKITSKNGVSIHRAFHGRKNISDMTKSHVGLTSNSIRLLNGDGDDPDFIDQVSISKGCLFLYYWNHPFHATRISMRIGIISILIGIFSIILSIIVLCF